MAAPGKLVVAHVVAPALQQTHGPSGILHIYGSIRIAVLDEDRDVEQPFRHGPGALLFVQKAVQRAQLGQIRFRHLGVVIGSSEHGRDGGEQVRMTAGDFPGAPPAHGIAREVHTIFVDAEEPLGLGDGMHNVAVPNAQVLCIPPAVGFHVDHALVIGELGVDARMAAIRGPPPDVDRIRRVVAVHLNHQRPLPGRVVIHRQVGAAVLRRAIHLVPVGQTHEAVRADASGLAPALQHHFVVFHQRRVDLQPRVALGLAEFGSQAILHHFGEHLEGEALRPRSVGLGGRGSQVPSLSQRIPLVPGKVGCVEKARKRMGAAAHLVGTIRPALGIDRHARASMGLGREHGFAAGPDHLDLYGFELGPFHTDVGLEGESIRQEPDDRRADLSLPHRDSPRLDHPCAE